MARVRILSPGKKSLEKALKPTKNLGKLTDYYKAINSRECKEKLEEINLERERAWSTLSNQIVGAENL
jgi:hypothetical protein